jgi:hypothetical protein
VRRIGVTLNSRYRWRKEAAVALAAQTVRPREIEGPRLSVGTVFVLALLAAAQLSVPPAPNTSSRLSLIEIMLAAGGLVRDIADVDASALPRIVAALEGVL